jgi:D-3-phosphoglycerate dehydrogenase
VVAKGEEEKPKYSFPKERINVLLLENIRPLAKEILEAEGYQVELLPKALPEAELLERIGQVSILGIRSNTNLSAAVLDRAKRLLAVGAFCIGTNKIDLPAAAGRGIVVFNAPFSNTRSVVEITIAEIIALSRRLIEKSALAHQGLWDKTADNSHEIRGLNLGIIGYGNIGSQLSVLAENLGMHVMYFDLADKLSMGNALRAGSLNELLKWSDFVTLHVDGRSENKSFFGEKEFALMKDDAVFLNSSRGTVVDLDALKKHLVSGHLAGAAVDVYPVEPKSRGEKFSSELQGLPNVILTPHVAGITEESQDSVARFVSAKLINFINQGTTAMSVNLPGLAMAAPSGSHRLILIHRNVPGVLAKINTMLSDRGVNVDGQYLGTAGETAYVLTDIAKTYPDDLLKELRALPETIRLRVLY